AGTEPSPAGIDRCDDRRARLPPWMDHPRNAGAALFRSGRWLVNRIAPKQGRNAAAACPSRGRPDRDDLEGMHVAVLVAARHTPPRYEGMGAEPIARLVVLVRALVVVEHPGRMGRPARLVHEAAHLVRLPFPEAAHPAMVAMLAPQLRVDVALLVQRRH